MGIDAQRQWAWLAIALALLALLVPLDLMPKERLADALETSAHVPAFLILVSALLALLKPPPGWRSLLLKLNACALLAVLLELAQHFTGRDPDGMDALFSALGGCFAVLALEQPRRARMMVGLAVALLVSVTVLPGLVLLDRSQARGAFPALASFESPIELGRWSGNQVQLQRVTEWASDGRHALRVTSEAGSVYPGLFMEDGVGDWTGRRVLVFNVVWLGAQACVLGVRADDHPGFPPYAERAQTEVTLAPGPNTIRLELDPFLRTPSGQPLNRAGIKRWGLFLINPPANATFLLDHIRLEQ